MRDKHAEILARVIEMVAARQHMPVSQVTADTNFVNDLNFDSLERVEMIMTSEDEFGITIPDADAENLATVGQVADYIVGREATAKEGIAG
jgi:acyl carrier protein